MKKKTDAVMNSNRVNSNNVIAYTSLAITLISVLWNVFFGYGKLVSRIDAMQEDIKEIKEEDIKEIKASIIRLGDKIDDIRTDIHRLDVRVTAIEQRKP